MRSNPVVQSVGQPRTRPSRGPEMNSIHGGSQWILRDAPAEGVQLLSVPDDSLPRVARPKSPSNSRPSHPPHAIEAVERGQRLEAADTIPDRSACPRGSQGIVENDETMKVGYFGVSDDPEQTAPVLNDGGDQIRTRRGVVVVREANGSPASSQHHPTKVARKIRQAWSGSGGPYRMRAVGHPKFDSVRSGAGTRPAPAQRAGTRPAPTAYPSGRPRGAAPTGFFS